MDGNRSVAILQVSRGWEDQLNQSLQLIPTKSSKSKDLSYGNWGPWIESMVISAWNMLVKNQPATMWSFTSQRCKVIDISQSLWIQKNVLLIQGFSRWNSRNISMQICMDTLVNCTKPTDLRQPKCLLRFDCSYPGIPPKSKKYDPNPCHLSICLIFYTSQKNSPEMKSNCAVQVHGSIRKQLLFASIFQGETF